MGRTDDGSLVGLFAARQRFDRTLKFDESLEAKVAALTPDQINAAFRKHIDAEGLQMSIGYTPRIRMVTHLDIDDAAIDRTIDVFARFMR